MKKYVGMALLTFSGGLLSACGSTYTPRPHYVTLVSTGSPARYNYQSPIREKVMLVIKNITLEDKADCYECEGGNCRITGR